MERIPRRCSNVKHVRLFLRVATVKFLLLRRSWLAAIASSIYLLYTYVHYILLGKFNAIFEIGFFFFFFFFFLSFRSVFNGHKQRNKNVKTGCCKTRVVISQMQLVLLAIKIDDGQNLYFILRLQQVFSFFLLQNFMHAKFLLENLSF